MDKMFLLQAQVPQKYLHDAMSVLEDCEGRAILVRPLRIALPAANGAVPALTMLDETREKLSAVGVVRAAILAWPGETVTLNDVRHLAANRHALVNAFYGLRKAGVLKKLGSGKYLKKAPKS